MDRRRFLIGLGAFGAISLTGCGKDGPTNAMATSTTSTTSDTQIRQARFVQRIEGSNAVALTFHGDGNPASTDAMLRELARLSLTVTVFCIGRWLDQYPRVTRQLLDEGHELGNHTYTHPTLRDLPMDAMVEEITRCRDVLTRQSGLQVPWFRPSGQDIVPPDTVLQAAKAAGYETVVGFDVDPFDYREPGPAAIVERIAAGISAGSIVSLHFGHSGTVNALADIASLLKQRQLTAVRVGQLLGR